MSNSSPQKVVQHIVNFVFLCSSFVLAQQIYQPEIYSKWQRQATPGVRVGLGQVHPALGVYGSFDSNALYESLSPNKDFVFEVVPGFDYIQDRRKLDLRLGYRFKLREHVKNKSQNNQAHTVDFVSSYDFSRRFSFALKDRFEKSSDPASSFVLERLNRIENQAKAELTYKAPGDNLSSMLGVSHTYLEYDANAALLSFFNGQASQSTQFEIGLNSKFRFLPKSTLSAQLQYGLRDFKKDSLPAPPTVSDSTNYGATLGLNTLVTRRYGFNLSGGINRISFDQGPSTLSWVGMFGLEYTPSARMSLNATYAHELQSSVFSNFYEGDRINFKANMRLKRKLRGMIGQEFGFYDYSGPNTVSSGVNRSDFVFQSVARLTYDFKPWVSTHVEYQFSYRDSNASDSTSVLRVPDFLRHLAMLGIEFYY